MLFPCSIHLKQQVKGQLGVSNPNNWVVLFQNLLKAVEGLPLTSKRPCLNGKVKCYRECCTSQFISFMESRSTFSTHAGKLSRAATFFFFPPYLLPPCFEKRLVSPGYFSVLQLSCDCHLLPQSKAQSTPLFQELAGQPWSRKQQATKLHNDKGVLLALHTNHFTCFTCIEIFCLLLSWRAALLLRRQLTCS